MPLDPAYGQGGRKLIDVGGPNDSLDAGALGAVDKAGLFGPVPPAVGMLKSSKHLSEPTQRHFADRNFEYPRLAGVPTAPGLPALRPSQGPASNLGDRADLAHTLDLLRQTGLL